MPILEGVRIGPMDPDSTADFGTVGAKNSARTLIRRHAAMHPPQLTGKLKLKRQDERSNALDMGEVRRAVEGRIEDDGQEVPEAFYITGAAVRGEDDQPSKQVVSFTYQLPSGRQGKGAIPYDAELLPNSTAAGDEAVRVKKAKDAGVPWVPQQVSESIFKGAAKASEPGEDDDADALLAEAEKERDDAIARAEKAETAQADFQRQLDEMAGQMSALREQQATVAPTPPSADPEAGRPPLPFEDFEGTSADTIKSRLAVAEGAEGKALAQSVLAYEQGPDGSNRSTVVKAAQSILDRPENAG